MHVKIANTYILYFLIDNFNVFFAVPTRVIFRLRPAFFSLAFRSRLWQILWS